MALDTELNSCILATPIKKEKTTVNQQEVHHVYERLQKADADWFEMLKHNGDFAKLHIARCYASSCNLTGEGGRNLLAAPVFIPLHIVSESILDPSVSVGAIETVVRGLLPDGMGLAMFPETKSLNGVLGMNPVEAMNFTQEAAISTMDGNQMYGYLAFDGRDDIQRVGRLYVHHAVLVGCLYVRDIEKLGMELKQINYQTRAEIAGFVAEELGLSEGVKRPIVLLSDIATFQTVHLIAAESRNFAAMMAIAQQGLSHVKYSMGGVSTDKQYLQYELRDIAERVICEVDVPAEREQAFHKQREYIEVNYGVTWEHQVRRLNS